MGGPKGFGTIRPVLLADYVRCVGDRIAFVVAETEQQARDAAELVEVDYDPLPVLVDAEQAAKPEAPVIWNDCPNGNVAVTIALGDKAATDAAFALAKYVASVRVVNNRSTPNALEPRCALGAYEHAQGKYTLYTASQDPHGVRTVLSSAVFRIPELKVRVLSPMSAAALASKPISTPRTRWCCGRPALRAPRQMDGDPRRKSDARHTRP